MMSSTAQEELELLHDLESEADAELEQVATRTKDDAPKDKAVPILWHSNAPWAGTGYGTQTALFGPLLAERLGFRVAFSAFYGLEGSQLGWGAPSGKGYVVYPRGRDPYGNDVLGAHAKHWFAGEGGLVVILTDPWVMSAEICARLPVLAWTPVDHEPLMPRTDEWLKVSHAIPIAMSRFGQRVMEERGHKSVYVPHGFDARIFKPPEDRERVRSQLGIPKDAFVVGMVAANKGVPSRKCFAEAARAFAAFRERIGRDAVLYLHTRLQDPEGENLPALLESCGVVPMTTDPYLLALGLKNSIVAAIMGCFDVILNPAQGEGFGIPIVEAQACGTPAIVTNFSSMPEVAPVDAGNWHVDGQPVWTVFESWQCRPSVEGLVTAMVEAYEEPTADRLARRESVHQWALSEYEAGSVIDRYWREALEDASLELNWRKNRMLYTRR